MVTPVAESNPENSFDHRTNLDNSDLSLSSRPAFGRRGTEDVLKGLPELPLYVDVVFCRS